MNYYIKQMPTCKKVCCDTGKEIVKIVVEYDTAENIISAEYIPDSKMGDGYTESDRTEFSLVRTEAELFTGESFIGSHPIRF